MKNQLYILCLLLLFASCIPISIAPKIEKHKIVVAKKFKRKLPKETSFVFNDPKDAGAFYDFTNAKYNLNHVDVGYNVLFKIDNKNYYLTYKEAERKTQVINLPFIVTDFKRESNGNTKLFEDYHTFKTRTLVYNIVCFR